MGEHAEDKDIDQADDDEGGSRQVPAAFRSERWAYRRGDRGQPFHPSATASRPGPAVLRSRKTARISAGAATKSTISPSSTWTMSAGTWPSVAASTEGPPTCSATNRSPAR